MDRTRDRAACWLAAGAVLFGVFASISGLESFDWVWRVAVLLAAAVASLSAWRRKRMPAVFVVALCLAGIGVASTDNSASSYHLDGLTWGQTIPDIIAGVGLVTALTLALRSRRGGLGRRELLDGIAVVFGAGLATWLVLAEPVAEAGVNAWFAMASTLYLPFAVVITTQVADLLVDGLTKNRSMWLIMLAAILNLVGCTVRCLIQVDVLPDSFLHLTVGLSISAFFLACAAVISPSMPEILQPIDTANANPRIESLRVAPLILSLSAPVVLMAVVAPTSASDQIVRAAVGGLLVIVIIARLHVALRTSAEAQQTLLDRIHRDDLTNLPTRTRFVEIVTDILDATWRSDRQPTIVQLNLDRFKNINDSLGHRDANQVLVLVGERLRDAVADFDGIVARSGGDDFVVVDASTTSAAHAMERVAVIQASLTAPIQVADSSIFVTASIGVAVTPKNRTMTAEELMRRADIATHRAKSDGRNQVAVFDESMQSHLTQRMDVEHALHGAIGRREMRLYHQPIVDIVSGQVTGFEALIRWQRSDGALIPPGDFIPIAEETGIICELGAWALHAALTELRGWIDDSIVPPTTTISVNVSPRQIADPTFADIVRAALDQSGVSPHLLWIEMTESMMLQEPEMAQRTLRQIRAMGVRLALDDFGTGYSSLSLLQQFPIQRIKIDRAFVQGIAERSNDRSLVRTIIAMARSMGLDLVAEGVETVHQLQSLRELGCDKAQGFLISHPVPPDAMRSTMGALEELASLALFGTVDEHSSLVAAMSGAANQPASSSNVPVSRMSSRPIGNPLV